MKFSIILIPPKFLPDWYLPTQLSIVSLFSLSLNAWSSFCATQLFFGVGLVLKYGHYISCHTSFKKKKKNLTSLFQKLSNTNSSPVRGGTLCPPLPSIQEFGLAWAYISLVHAVTAAMSSYDHNCYAVSRKEFSSSHPLPLSLRIFLTPFPWRFMTLGVTGIVIKWLNELLLYPQVSASLNPLSCSRSHLTETHNWPVCREWETWTFSTLCRRSILHSVFTLYPSFRELGCIVVKLIKCTV